MTINSLEEFHPQGKRVLVRPLLEDEKTEGGVLRVTRKKTIFGQVLRVGPKCDDLRVGDVIVYDKWNQGTTPVTIDGEELFLPMETDIIAVFERADS